MSADPVINLPEGGGGQRAREGGRTAREGHESLKGGWGAS